MAARKNGGGQAGKRRETTEREHRRSLIFRVLRGLFGLGLIAGIVAIIGSYFMREQVIKRLTSRAAASSAMVYTRPFALSRGVNIKGAKVLDRLQRMGYQEVPGSPAEPGQYTLSGANFDIYLRESDVPSLVQQPEKIVRLSLGPETEITQIIDKKFNRPEEHVWLEPEPLSLLGNTESRAVTPKSLSQFSPMLVSAVLAIEDERFYHHFGIDPIGIVRAMAVNIRSGRIVQGGSTITQQLAKNLFFESDRNFLRKIIEAFSAVLIETAFTKNQILEFYLNEVFLGQEGNVAIHGFGEAAKSFFGKEASDISIAQAATLAGIIKAPSAYSPRRSPEKALMRRTLVLRSMHEQKKITEKQFKQASAEKLHVQDAQRSRRLAPYFVDYIARSLETIVQPEDLTSPDLRIFSGIDLEYQKCAEEAVQEEIKRLEKGFPRLKRSKAPLQAALIAVSPASGEPLAWVGGRDYSGNQYDRVSQAKRQPGSAFKPFVYLTALDSSLNNYRVARTSSTLADEPISLDIPGSKLWEPQNYDNQYRGEVTLRQALAHSLNIPTVHLAMKVGIENVARTAELFGFGTDLPRVPSLALGAGEVSPFEMARAYATLANGGLMIDLQPLTLVSRKGEAKPLFKVAPEEHRVVSEQAVFVLTDMMQSVVNNGTGNVVRRMGFKLPVAGKTGTTNDMRDAWFVAFTPRVLAVVWVGYDNNDPVRLTGSQAAAPIWTNFMLCASNMEPKLDFVPPPGIIYRKIDARTGLLDTGYCPSGDVVTEIFIEGTEPVTPCTEHGPYVTEVVDRAIDQWERITRDGRSRERDADDEWTEPRSGKEAARERARAREEERERRERTRRRERLTPLERVIDGLLNW